MQINKDGILYNFKCHCCGSKKLQLNKEKTHYWCLNCYMYGRIKKEVLKNDIK